MINYIRNTNEIKNLNKVLDENKNENNNSINVDNKYSCGKCHKWFDEDQFKKKETKLYGKLIIEKVCPYCDYNGWTKKSDETFFDKYDVDKYYTQRYY